MGSKRSILTVFFTYSLMSQQRDQHVTQCHKIGGKCSDIFCAETFRDFTGKSGEKVEIGTVLHDLIQETFVYHMQKQRAGLYCSDMRYRQKRANNYGLTYGFFSDTDLVLHLHIF